MTETGRQRAKREKKAYIKILIDTRYVEPKKGARIAIEGPFDPVHVDAFYKAVWRLIDDRKQILVKS